MTKLKDNDMLVIADHTKEIAIQVKELKKLEEQAKAFKVRIEALKESLKKTNFSKIWLKTDADDIMITITKFEQHRVSWDSAYLEKLLSDEQKKSARKETTVECVKVSIK